MKSEDPDDTSIDVLRRNSDCLGLQDHILLSIQDGMPVPKKELRELPPWRAVLLADVAVKAGLLDAEYAIKLREEAIKVGGVGSLRPHNGSSRADNPKRTR